MYIIDFSLSFSLSLSLFLSISFSVSLYAHTLSYSSFFYAYFSHPLCIFFSIRIHLDQCIPNFICTHPSICVRNCTGPAEHKGDGRRRSCGWSNGKGVAYIEKENGIISSRQLLFWSVPIQSHACFLYCLYKMNYDDDEDEEQQTPQRQRQVKKKSGPIAQTSHRTADILASAMASAPG